MRPAKRIAVPDRDPIPHFARRDHALPPQRPLLPEPHTQRGPARRLVPRVREPLHAAQSQPPHRRRRRISGIGIGVDGHGVRVRVRVRGQLETVP